MARPKLRSANQPWPLRVLLAVFETCASLKLAVMSILSVAVVLGAATFVESAYGTRVVQFALYGTWWFTLLSTLLAVNIFCAAAIRYPWKRHQTGFLITHLGLLILLSGCWLTRRGWIDAQMPILEGDSNRLAYLDSQHFQLTVHRSENSDSTATAMTDEQSEQIHIPFVGGPFNWQQYETPEFAEGTTLLTRMQKRFGAWFFRLPYRDRGAIYNQEGIKLEVLDYFGDSRLVEAPTLKIQLSGPRPETSQREASDDSAAMMMPPLALTIRANPHGGPLGVRRSVGGGSIGYWIAGSAAQQVAFLNAGPSGPATGTGQVVLRAGTKTFSFQVAEKQPGERFPLGQSDLQVEFAEVVEDPPAVRLRVNRAGEGDPRDMMLFADTPEANRHDPGHGVYGDYWFDRGELSAEDRMQGLAKKRVDILQGIDEQLYYRRWDGHQVVGAGKLGVGREAAIDAFTMAMGTISMHVAEHITSQRPDVLVIAEGFNKNLATTQTRRAAKLRLTVDGNSEEFWLLGLFPEISRGSPLRREIHTVHGERRAVVVQMPLDTVDIGFDVELEDFERKLDPGTSQPSDYSSRVNFVTARQGNPSIALRDVRIGMNAPVDFTDPDSGRRYRLFQESFQEPFKPGDRAYEDHLAMLYAKNRKVEDRDKLYVSILTVNYDPGRGLKYLGAGLVIAGIATMFFMRAYFFTPRPQDAVRRSV